MAATIVTGPYGHDIAGPTAKVPTNVEPGMEYMDTDLNVLLAAQADGVLRPVVGQIGVSTYAAAGTNQSTATAILGSRLATVTAADGTKGVLLPVIALGTMVRVYNSSASPLKVYPAGTSTINGGSASVAVTVPANTLVTFAASSATNWAFDLPSSSTGNQIVDSLTGGLATLPINGLAAAQGGSVTISGGTSSTAGNAGGAAGLVGGTPGITGVGGAVSITSGPGGATSGAAGAITIAVGAATSGAGSGITITAGAGAGGTSAGGNLNLVGGTAVSTGIPGEVQVIGDSAFMHVSEALTATDATRTVLVCVRPCRLKYVREVHTTASSSGTLTVEKATGTTAPGSGTALLTGTMSLAGTANTVVSGTLIATVASLTFAAGDRMNIVIAGTMTGLAGSRVTIGLAPC